MNLKLKRICELSQYFIKELKKDGVAPTIRRTAAFVKRRTGKKKGRFLPSAAVLSAQKQKDMSLAPCISICVPLYNTPVQLLKEMLDSVINQSCNRWQLCLADASDNDGLKPVIESYNHSQISYIKIKNKGISENTNAAAKLAAGEFIALLDHDDVLSPNAVYEMCLAAMQGHKFIYSDEALFSTDIQRPVVGHFKPDFAPDYLRCCNYICHFACFSAQLFWQAGGENSQCDGAQDHDLFLKLSELTTPYHIPKVLYYWRVHEGSTSGGTGAKPYVERAAINAINAHLKRTGVKGETVKGLFPSTYKVNYQLDSSPLISILIPNKDHVDDLDKAIKSINDKTAYRNFEIIIIENNSADEKTFEYYEALCSKYSFCKVVKYSGDFNFSAINNFGAKAAKGEYLLLLNNDVEVINGEWLYEMLCLCMQDKAGIVGSKLYYPDDTVQHAGVIVGLGGFAGHSHKYARREASGYMFRLATVQNFSAVTAACLMIGKKVFDEVNGLDEGFKVAFNDVDFCLRVKAAGYRIIYTPYAQLYHYESKSRGLDVSGEAKKRFDSERARLLERWGESLLKDEFYSPNLTLDREDFSENDVFPKEV